MGHRQDFSQAHLDPKLYARTEEVKVVDRQNGVNTHCLQRTEVVTNYLCAPAAERNTIDQNYYVTITCHRTFSHWAHLGEEWSMHRTSDPLQGQLSHHNEHIRSVVYGWNRT